MNGTLIYLKTICDQLKEVLGLCDGLNVCAMIDDKEDPHKVLGWCIVRLLPDGHIRPIDSKRYHTIREMIHDALPSVNGVIEGPEPLFWRVVSDNLEGAFVLKNKLRDGDNVKIIIIKENNGDDDN